jgi:hypothetical protein
VNLRIWVAVAGLALLIGGSAAAQEESVHVTVPTGWTAPDQEYRFDRENLWEYINGAADLFLSYGFRELIVRDLEQEDRFVSVSVYDMGRPLDAFGVYEREKPEDEPAISGIGAAAILQPPYRGLMLKDRFYVKAEVGGGEVGDEALAALLREIAAGLPGRDDLPAQLAALPPLGRVPGTVAFAGQAFLGLADLANCVHADYRLEDGTEYRRFVMKPSRRLLADDGGRWARSALGDGRELWSREVPYSGVVVLVGDTEQMVGIAGLADLELATSLLIDTP